MHIIKLKRSDFWIYLIIAFILGIVCTVCFSSPPPKPDSFALGSGFFENNGPKRQVGNSPSTAIVAGKGQSTEQQSRPTLIVTAYCPCEKCCGEFADGVTASGHIIEPNDCFVAADPNISFGTCLSIPGYAGGRMVSVEDRGGAIQGNRLDVFFPTHDEALAWGIREFEVKQ